MSTSQPITGLKCQWEDVLIFKQNQNEFPIWAANEILSLRDFSATNTKVDTFAYVLPRVSRHWHLHMTLKHILYMLQKFAFIICVFIFIDDYFNFSVMWFLSISNKNGFLQPYRKAFVTSLTFIMYLISNQAIISTSYKLFYVNILYLLTSIFKIISLWYEDNDIKKK